MKLFYFGVKHYCPVCNNSLRKFLSFSGPGKINEITINGQKHIPAWETLNTKNYLCPVCKSTDRGRLISLYLNHELIDIKNSNINIVHFSPELISKFITNNKNISYKTADKYSDNTDYKADITNLKIFKNNFFDYFICSHILEHIDNDLIAIKELYRILKNKGKGVMLVPIDLSLSYDYENKKVRSPEEKLENFGQEDHVRVYSKNGFMNKLKLAGFKVDQLDKNFFKEHFLKKCGIDIKSILYIVKK